MVNRYLLIRAMSLAAVREGKKNGRKPIEVLEDIVVGRFNSDFVDGKTVIGTAEGGGSVSFAMPENLSPAEVVSLAMETIMWINEQDDPENPPLYPARRIKRLRVSFAKATI